MPTAAHSEVQPRESQLAAAAHSTVARAKVVAPALPNIPWEDRPPGSEDLLWRYSKNPVVGRRPMPRVTGIYNSAVVPFR